MDDDPTLPRRRDEPAGGPATPSDGGAPSDRDGGDPERPRFLPPTPTGATLTRALQVAAAGALLLLAGVAWLALGVCDADGACAPGPARTGAEATATVGFLVLLGAGAYACTAAAHLLAVRRRDRRR
ncbi:MAG: hypothetical protein ACLGIR_00215 [Actinomycetes bacterium]